MVITGKGPFGVVQGSDPAAVVLQRVEGDAAVVAAPVAGKGSYQQKLKSLSLHRMQRGPVQCEKSKGKQLSV